MSSRPKSRLPTGLFVKKPVTALDKRSNVPAKSVMAGGKRLLSGFSVRHSMKMTMFCREQHCDSTSQFVKSIWVDLFFWRRVYFHIKFSSGKMRAPSLLFVKRFRLFLDVMRSLWLRSKNKDHGFVVFFQECYLSGTIDKWVYHKKGG